MTAEECIERIEKVLSKEITLADSPQFHLDGTSTTVLFTGGKETLMRLVEISDIIKEWRNRTW